MVYFNIYNVSEAYKIPFACLKMSGHALVWWESYFSSCEEKKLLIYTWDGFKDLLRKNFYPISCETNQNIKWLYCRQGSGLSVQNYTIDVCWQAMLPSMDLEGEDILTKYLRRKVITTKPLI